MTTLPAAAATATTIIEPENLLRMMISLGLQCVGATGFLHEPKAGLDGGVLRHGPMVRMQSWGHGSWCRPVAWNRVESICRQTKSGVLVLLFMSEDDQLCIDGRPHG